MKKEEYLKKNNQEIFDKKYTETNFITKRLISNFYRNIENMVVDKNINSILDVACGHGFSTKYISEILKGKYIEASDYEYYLVEDAKKLNPNVKISKESIYHLNRQNGSFDLVLALEVLEHLEDPENAIKELKRVTKQYCIVSVPNEPLWRILNISRGKYLKDFGNTPGHINHWSRRQFVQLIGVYFEIQEVRCPLPWTIILAQKKV